MPEQTPDNAVPGAATPLPAPPVPDLGFFAGPPASTVGSGGFGGTVPSQFGGAGSSPFGTSAASPFGTPAASPFGTPAPRAATTGIQPVRSGLTTGWKAAALAAAVVVLTGLVLGGRFGWQQFVADPVAPDTLLGMPRVGDVSDEEIKNIQDGLSGELSTGSAAKVALYSDGQGTGYMLFAVRGGSSPDSGSGDDAFASWTKTEQDGTACYSNPAQAAAGVGATMCMNGFWRRGVIVLGMGLTAPDPATVARATNEAWDAQ